MEVDDGGKKEDGDEAKRESTQEYLSRLGIGGKKRRKKDADEPTEKKKDYTAELEVASGKADALVASGDLDGAIKAMLPLEKKTRLSQDSSTCSKVVQKILEMIFYQLKFVDKCPLDHHLQMVVALLTFRMIEYP